MNTSLSCSLVAAVTWEGRRPAVSPACPQLGTAASGPKGITGEASPPPPSCLFAFFTELKRESKALLLSDLTPVSPGGREVVGREAEKWRSPEGLGVCRARPGGGSRMGAVAPSCSTGLGIGAIPELPCGLVAN